MKVILKDFHAARSRIYLELLLLYYFKYFTWAAFPSTQMHFKSCKMIPREITKLDFALIHFYFIYIVA